MTSLLLDTERLAPMVMSLAISAAALMALAVVAERAAFAWREVRRRHVEEYYQPIITRVLDGDIAARRDLVVSPQRHRLMIAARLIEPLIRDRDPDRVAAARAAFREMGLVVTAERYLGSRLWWRRAVALRVLGLLQSTEHTVRILAALDDARDGVRAAALDALADLQDPASLQAIVARLHDTTLHRGRRGVALAAFGPRCEPFLLELAEIHHELRANYALALAICGTAAARPVLCAWTSDDRVEVRAAALQALAFMGLDERCVPAVMSALEDREPSVRAMAAQAFRGWTRSEDAAPRLARHLHDTWTVASTAAQSLGSMGNAGLAELRASAGRDDLAGVLARQVLWESAVAS